MQRVAVGVGKAPTTQIPQSCLVKGVPCVLRGWVWYHNIISSCPSYLFFCVAHVWRDATSGIIVAAIIPYHTQRFKHGKYERVLYNLQDYRHVNLAFAINWCRFCRTGFYVFFGNGISSYHPVSSCIGTMFLPRGCAYLTLEWAFKR